MAKKDNAFAETGVFPSIDGKGRQRMGSENGQDGESRQVPLVEYRLRGLFHGHVAAFVDDLGSAAEANQARQHLGRMLLKRDKESGEPMWFVDEGVKVPPVACRPIGVIPVPVATATTRAVMARHVEKNEELAALAETRVKKEKKRIAEAAIKDLKEETPDRGALGI